MVYRSIKNWGDKVRGKIICTYSLYLLRDIFIRLCIIQKFYGIFVKNILWEGKR
jgi:hypothetical protein